MSRPVIASAQLPHSLRSVEGRILPAGGEPTFDWCLLAAVYERSLQTETKRRTTKSSDLYNNGPVSHMTWLFDFQSLNIDTQIVLIKPVHIYHI